MSSKPAPMDLCVESEVGPLEAIITHPPGPELDLMVPENLERTRLDAKGLTEANPNYLLFDDLVLLRAAQAEHAALTACLKAVAGSDNHHTVRELLAGILGQGPARDRAIDGVLSLESELYGVPDSVLRQRESVLRNLDASALCEALICGALPPATGPTPAPLRRILSWPAPNALFARDLAAITGSAITVTHAANPGRRRDLFLMGLIHRFHPLFRGNTRVDIADDGPLRPPNGPHATLEGGDILVLNASTLLVGVSLRTTRAAVARLAPRLRAHGFDTLITCALPRRRAAMHIDTLFTRISATEALVYPPLFERAQDLGVQLHRYSAQDPEDGQPMGHDLFKTLADHGVRLTPLRCGGTDPIAQAREQWSDGANAFALAPGVIIGYGRNDFTLRELVAAGYRIRTPEAFVQDAPALLSDPSARIVIALEGHELVRGRGGPRCLTLPLRRALVAP